MNFNKLTVSEFYMFHVCSTAFQLLNGQFSSSLSKMCGKSVLFLGVISAGVVLKIIQRYLCGFQDGSISLSSLLDSSQQALSLKRVLFEKSRSETFDGRGNLNLRHLEIWTFEVEGKQRRGWTFPPTAAFRRFNS